MQPAATMSRHPARRRYDRRGAAMLAVTLLGVAAAMLSILIVRQVVAASRATMFEDLSAQARQQAESAVDDVTARLQADPSLAFRQVLPDEAPRVCSLADPADADLLAANADHPTYPAGADWPDACGTWWTHEPTEVDPMVVKVLPPSEDADLQAQALAAAGKVQAGATATLRTPDAAAFAVWTDGNLSVDELADGDVTLQGTVYAARRILLPTETVTFGDVQLAGLRCPTSGGCGRGATPSERSRLPAHSHSCDQRSRRPAPRSTPSMHAPRSRRST